MSIVVSRGARAMGAMSAEGGLPRAMPADAPAWMTAMDRNGDGELSRREFLGSSRQFAAIDRNADGVIDASEARDTESAGASARP